MIDIIYELKIYYSISFICSIQVWGSGLIHSWACSPTLDCDYSPRLAD